MSRIVHRKLLLSLMAGASLVMGGIVFTEISARPTIPDPATSTDAGEVRVPSLPEPRAEMPAKENFAVIVDRPLFSPSRRPPAEGTTVASIPALDFSLFGIVISTAEPAAIVKPESGGDPVRVTEGETMSGWTVARIEADRVLVQYGATERELLLDFSAPAPPPPEMAMPNDTPADGQTAQSASAQSGGIDNAQHSETPPPEAEEPEATDQSKVN